MSVKVGAVCTAENSRSIFSPVMLNTSALRSGNIVINEVLPRCDYC